MLTKSDGAIDFSASATQVAARIRGVDPWPGAQAALRGQVVKLFRARAFGFPDGTQPIPQFPDGTQPIPTSDPVAPGYVTTIDASGIHVVTGSGVVVIREIQAPGRKRMTAMQFAAGRGVAVGDVFEKPVIE